MFTERPLDGDPAAVRDAYAPDAVVLNSATDFETLDPAAAEDLLLVTRSVDPLALDPSWVPDSAPDQLRRYVGGEFTVGLPGDGGVAWTTQTEPACVIVKPRLETSPDAFVDFLVAEALVEASLNEPEQFVEFFGDSYRDLAAVTDPAIGATGTYQLAVALYDAYLGLQTREAFEGWAETFPAVYAAWADAGERLEPRLSELSGELARGQTDFAAAAELACSAVKHGLELPAPFAALDTAAYADHDADYAVRWAEKTFEQLE
ncbi:hypothetical protein NDI56_13700 [Haloarcula sp. S1CR25-12]|uniref:ABC transporter substrate-binding protein n=1 Tax=Haloarcula saliterrae TaxID=2950534 RepID=A0ABU2FDY8_9EURY|nr:hypothetical protein [Haloarcula sp. S1CR25-12]MDS0260454.1 hypothetical protein [Haloarcula sp. S1CR25-12]